MLIDDSHEILGIYFSNAELISIGLLTATILTVYLTSKSNSFNARTSDVDNYLRIYDRLQKVWDDYDPDVQSRQQQEISLEKIVNNYEIVCHLYNIKFFRGASREMLNSFLHETVSQMVTTESVVNHMKRSASSDSTYREIQLFCVRKRINNHLDWKFSPIRYFLVYLYLLFRPYKYFIPFIN